MNDTIRIERYSFTLSKTLPIGRPASFELVDRPTAGFHPQVLMGNMSEPGLVYISAVKVGGIDIFVMDGEFDLYSHHPSMLGCEIDMPEAPAGTEFRIIGRYTGKRPTGAKRWWQFWKKGWPLHIACNFKGPALLGPALDDEEVTET